MSKGRTGSRRKRIPPDATPEQIQEIVRRGQQRYQAQTALRAQGPARSPRGPRQTPADERREEQIEMHRQAFIANAIEHRNELAQQGWAPIGHDGRPTAWPAD